MVWIIDRSLEIDAPADTVWHVLTDLPSYDTWNPFVPDLRSSLQPGSPIEMQVQLGPRLRRQVEWMLTYEAGRAFSYRMRPLPLGALSSLREQVIEPLDAQRCRYRSHFELRGWLMPLVRRQMAPALEKGFSGMAQGLKRRAESLWSNPPIT